MAKVDLSSMSLMALTNLEVQVSRMKSEARTREIDALREKFAAMAAKRGYTLAQVMGTAKRGKRGPVEAKYRNPKNTSQTWSGRGRRPLWLTAAMKKKGKTLASFAI